MSFATDMTKANAAMKGQMMDVRNISLLGVFSGIINDTPVLTGDLRGSWQIGTEMDDDPTPKNQDTQRQFAAIRKSLDELKPGETVFFFNNLPYAWRIEFEGHSEKKAPEGMVRININRFPTIVKKVAKEVNG